MPVELMALSVPQASKEETERADGAQNTLGFGE